MASRLSLLPAYPRSPSVCLRPAHTSVAGKRLALSPGQPVRPCAAAREACAPLPQGSLAPARVMLSRSIVAYYDPIRQSRRHAATSRLGRLYAAPSLCGSASATRGTFPTFAAVPSMHVVDPAPTGPPCPPVVLTRRFQASSNYHRVATREARLCQQCPTGYFFSGLHRSLYATTCALAEPS